MTSKAINRILKESECIRKDKNFEYYKIDPIKESDCFKWKGEIYGPIGSPYEKGVFKIGITFPENYPFKPPRILFLTPIYHPNINESGDICLDTLKDKWAATFGINTALLSVISLLTDPNPDDPLNGKVANVYKMDKKQFIKNAKKHTEEHAIK